MYYSVLLQSNATPLHRNQINYDENVLPTTKGDTSMAFKTPLILPIQLIWIMMKCSYAKAQIFRQQVT